MKPETLAAIRLAMDCAASARDAAKAAAVALARDRSAPADWQPGAAGSNQLWTASMAAESRADHWTRIYVAANDVTLSALTQPV